MADTETFQHYQVLKHPDGSLWELGRGAMGVTYKAFDTSLRCQVALKVINAAYLDSDMARQRFLREARAAAGLSHPNVANVFHLGEEGGNYFYAMEFIDGETLEAFVRRKGPLPPALALDIALQVARALRAASREGLVHRDIKPANLMLVREDDDDGDGEPELHVKVIDFGLAKVAQKDGTEASATITVAGFVGTPHYASPEQLEEKVLDVRSDMYSLGVTLWYMLTGRPPFGGSMVQIMSQHLTRKPDFELLRGAPPAVRRLLEHLLEKDPAKRPQTPLDLRREIEAAAREVRDERPIRSAPADTVAPGGTAVTDVPPESSYPTLAAPDGDPLAGSDESAPAGEPATGTVLAGRYRLLRTVARGAHGTVFQALELDRGRPLALKLLPPGLLDAPEAFAHSGAVVQQARSALDPSLLEVYALERAGKHVFLTCEWVNGFTLVELLRHRGALTFDETLRCLEPLATAVDHARQGGLCDLDLGPAQVLVAFEATLDLPAQTTLLGTPLARWPAFRPKIYPFPFPLDSPPEHTWSGLQTMVPAAAAKVDVLRQIALLAYELLGGSPTAPTKSQPRPPLAALTERGNLVLRQALSDAQPPAFPRAADLIAALRESAVPKRPEIGKTPAVVKGPVAAVPTPPPFAPLSATPATRPNFVPPVAGMPAMPTVPPATPSRNPLLIILLLLVIFIILGIVGGASYAAWKIFNFASTQTHPAKEVVRHHSPAPGPLPTATAAPLASTAPTPPPTATPAQVNRAKEMMADADALERNGDDAGALDAYVKVAEDYPESDPGLSRLDSFVERLRSRLSAGGSDPRRAQRLRAPMERAARLGSDAAMLYLGDHLRATEPAAAAEWYRQAAEKGRPEAMLALGDMYYRGTGVPLAPSEATRWYQLASDKGYPKAKVYLAECYERGIGGMPRDFDKSFALLNDALHIDPNNGDATEKLAEEYERGRGTIPDARQAFLLMKRAVDLGNTAAIGNLGAYYMRGLGQKADPKMAAAMFKQGVDKNNAACMFFYAQCLQDGRGTARNPEEAVGYFRAAAERDFPPARDWCRENGISFVPAARPTP